MTFEKLKKDYLGLANSKSAGNDIMNSFMFLSLLGANCHRNRLYVSRYGLKDLRIHQMLIQPSRTGKGESLKVLGQALGYCGLTYTDQTQFTDAGIVGKINSNQVTANRTKGYTPDDPEYIDPITLGDLGIYDLISFSEGKQMIKTNAYSDDKLEILQGVMDTPGKLRKKLSDEIPIEYESNTSIIGTTYPLKDFEDIFLQQGIFQRMLIYVREFSMLDRRSLNRTLCLEEPVAGTESQYDDKMRKLCQNIVNQTNRIPNGTHITFSEEGKEALFKRITKWTDLMEKEFRGEELMILSSYTTSSINLYSKIAAIAAVYNNAREITSKEVLSAHWYITEYLDSIRNEILMKTANVDDRAMKRVILQSVNRNPKKFTAKDIVKQMSDMHPEISDTRFHKMVIDLVKKEKILKEVKIETKDSKNNIKVIRKLVRK